MKYKSYTFNSDQDSEASADRARGAASKRPTSLNSARMPVVRVRRFRVRVRVRVRV